jgi:hypothetical protein
MVLVILDRVDRTGSGGLITCKDVAMGRVGRHAGVGGFLGPVPPSKPILSRAEEDCPRALYFGVGGGSVMKRNLYDGENLYVGENLYDFLSILLNLFHTCPISSVIGFCRFMFFDWFMCGGHF